MPRGLGLSGTYRTAIGFSCIQAVDRDEGWGVWTDMVTVILTFFGSISFVGPGIAKLWSKHIWYHITNYIYIIIIWAIKPSISLWKDAVNPQTRFDNISKQNITPRDIYITLPIQYVPAVHFYPPYTILSFRSVSMWKGSWFWGLEHKPR